MRNLLASCLLLSCVQLAHAHGGGLDANGCHHDRKTGDYHCHRAGYAPIPAQPPAYIPPAAPGWGAPAAPIAPAQPGSPECFVGPRGGTYTITPSGRKNYNGC